jgi:hypothetical protein
MLFLFLSKVRVNTKWHFNGYLKRQGKIRTARYTAV